MREIKFRGKDVDKRLGWHYGFYFRLENVTKKLKRTFISENGRTYEVDPETIGEFTGLLDKNKVEIYEGDLIKAKCNGWTTTSSEVYFGIDGSQVEIGDYLKQLSNTQQKDREVIGNIYENKNLLEAK